jgi:asparagine synthase (glutamine-hydrolysing)
MSAIVQVNDYRVMLCGMGGDEMNGQSLDPRVQLADLLSQLRWREFAHLLMTWSLCMRQPWIHVFLQVIGKLLPPSVQARLASRGRPESWVQPSFARKQKMSARQLESLDGALFARPAARDAAQTLATLGKQLTHAAPSLLEQRYPFLDQDLVEFLTTIPLDQLLRPGQRRSLMRRSLASLLPPEITSRKTKTSAGRCYPITLAKHWDKIEQLLACPLVARLGYIKREAMHQSLLAMKEGHVPSSFLRLLKALSLELWVQNALRCGALSLDLLRSPHVTEMDATFDRSPSKTSTAVASAVVDS